MNQTGNSGFIFDLIDDFQLFDSNHKPKALTDESLFQFLEKYKELADYRDKALYQYLISTPTLFRAHLPFSKWVFSVVFSVVWYYDELVINDPILQLIESGLNDEVLEQRKDELIH